MGVFSIGRKGERALSALAQEVQDLADAGHRRFSVTLYRMSDGTANVSIRRMRDAGRARLLSLGVSLVDARWEPWEYTMYYSIEVPERRAPEKDCPRCAEAVKAAAWVCRYCGYEFDDGAGADAAMAMGGPGRTVTYQLDEWRELIRDVVAHRLAEADIDHAWDGADLTVRSSDEEVVDRLLDEVDEDFPER